MKVLMINSVCGIRSTGRICTDIADRLVAEGHECKIAYGREHVPDMFQKYAVRIGSELGNRISAMHTRLTDQHGFANKRATKQFLRWAEEYDPDLLWIHNIHGYYIHVELLFDWIKSRPNMQVKWTLHDCWPFTGHCTYFTAANCEKWKTHCNNCPQTKCYPCSYLRDNCIKNFEHKKAAFTGVSNMKLITPSQWLADLVKQSFLGEYPVEVCNNTIDLNVFKPTPGNFKERMGIQKKKIILGVASVWDERKGLADYLNLAEMLDASYTVVLVGLSAKQQRHLPGNVIGISRTNSTKELAEIYTAADVFVNLTYEDNYPTVNLEARACGTPIITYKTGGSPESAGDKAIVIPQGDLQGVKAAVLRLCGERIDCQV